MRDDSRRGSKVTTDGSKVKGRNGTNKTIQWTIVLAIPNTGAAAGLILKDLLCAPDTKTQEISQLCDVDLGLEYRFGLSQHGRSV